MFLPLSGGSILQGALDKCREEQETPTGEVILFPPSERYFCAQPIHSPEVMP